MNLKLVMIAVLAEIAMFSAAVVVLPMQQASAQDTSFSFKQYQSNSCSVALCSNSRSTTLLFPETKKYR